MCDLLIAAAAGLFIWIVLALMLWFFGIVGYFLALAFLALVLWWVA